MRTRILLTWFLFVILLGVGAPTALAAPQAVCISTGSGSWSSSIWSCAGGPTANDIVIINDSHSVTLDTNGAAYQLIVGGGTSGSLSLTSYVLTVGAGGVSVSSGAALIGGIGGTLNVSGNLTNNGTFLTGTNTTVVMNGTSAQSISGGFTFNNLTINNAAGVTLNSNATVDGTLTLTTDLTTLSGVVLTMGLGSATIVGNADVVGKVKRASLSAGTPYTFGSAYTTITFGSSGTLPSEVSVELFKTAPGGLANAAQRYYSITPTGGSGYTFDLRLHYRDTELNGITEANLQMWQQVNGRWTLRAVTNRNTTDNWVETTGLTGFSLWALSDSGAPTAVNLSSFDARADTSNVLPFVGLGALALIALGAGAWWWRK